MINENSPAKEVHQNIKQMLTALVELGGGVIVHEDTHISWASSPNDPILITDPRNKKDPSVLCVYSIDCKIPKSTILNPLAEAIGEMTNDKKWFYAVTSMTYSRAVSNVVGLLLNTAVAANNGTMEIKDPYFIHALEGIVKHVDDKSSKEFQLITGKIRKYEDELDDQMLEEFQLITKANLKDFVTLVYDKKSKTASLITCFQDAEDQFKKQFGTRIRKKTWVLLETLFKELFACEDLSKSPIQVQTSELKCPQFRTYTEVLTQGWSYLLPYLSHVYGEDTAEQMSQAIVFLESCLPHLTRFANKGMWTSSGTIGNISLEDGSMISKSEVSTKSKYSPLPVSIVDDEIDERNSLRDLRRDERDIRLAVRSDGPRSTLDLLNIGHERDRDRFYRDDDRDRDRGRGRSLRDRDWCRDRGRDSRDSRDFRDGSRNTSNTLDLVREQEERRRDRSSSRFYR